MKLIYKWVVTINGLGGVNILNFMELIHTVPSLGKTIMIKWQLN